MQGTSMVARSPACHYRAQVTGDRDVDQGGSSGGVSKWSGGSFMMPVAGEGVDAGTTEGRESVLKDGLIF